MHNRRVLLLRDAPQWSAVLSEAGYEVMTWPALHAAPRTDGALLQHLKNHYDIAIWLSPNAVCYAQKLVSKHQCQMLATKHIAIGPSTAQALTTLLDIQQVDMPNSQWNTEGILMLLSLQAVQGKKIILIKGTGGRRKLRQCLIDQGADVFTANVYRRVVAVEQAKAWREQWRILPPAWVICSSVSSVRALGLILSHLKMVAWQSVHLWASSVRVARAARKLGVQKITVIGNAPCDPIRIHHGVTS